MELDDLKYKWQNSNATNTSTSKQKIMELIQQKSHGPVAALKTALRRQLLIIPFLAVLVVKAVIDPRLQTDPFFALFFGIAVLTCIFFAIAYFIIDNMSKSDKPVADQLKRQFRSLQHMLLSYRIVTLAGVVMLVIFLEVFKNMWYGAMLQWYDVDIWLRILAYVGLLVFSYSLSKAQFQREYGKHLDELKKRLSEIE